jgi:hypothetical protein
MKKQILILSISLLTSQVFGMAGSEQQFNEALRQRNFDYAESIIKSFRKQNQFQKAKDLERQLNEAKVKYLVELEQGITPQPPQPTPGVIPPPPPAPEAPLYTPPQPVGDMYAHVRALLAKSSLGFVDRRTLEMELENPNLPSDLRQAIDAKLGNVPTPPPAPPAPPVPPMPGEQPRPEGQFKWVQDEQGNWKKVPATQEQQGQIPTPPPAPEAPLYTPPQPVGDVYAHVQAILAKPSLGLVDRRTLEMELENPNLPSDLRQAINAKLGNVPTPPPAPPAPPAPPMPGEQPAQTGKFKWVQDEQGNWQRVPATEGEQKPAEDEDLGLRGLFGE